MPVPKVRNTGEFYGGGSPASVNTSPLMSGPTGIPTGMPLQEPPDDSKPAGVTPSNAAPTGNPQGSDPLDTLKSFLAKQQGAASPTPILPRPIDPSVWQEAQKNMAMASLVSGLTTHTPNWYEVSKGKGATDLNPGATQMMESAAQMPLHAALQQRQLDAESAKILNDFSEKAANRQNTFDVGKMHAGAAALMVPTRAAVDVQKAKDLAPIQVDTATKKAEATAPIRVEAAKAKIPGPETTNINKAEEIINRAEQTKALLHKYGNLGPLLQYGTIPAALARAAHMDSTIKDNTGRAVPADELANDANELQGHVTYLTKEAPRVLAAGGRMDLQSIRALGQTFPGPTDSEESGTKKLDQYGHHAFEWIRKSDAAHGGNVRKELYGGGPLPGEERYGGQAVPTGGEERKTVNGKSYVKRSGQWEEE